MISYVNTNQNFLFLYLISEFDYNNGLSIMNSFVNKFNTINQTNINKLFTDSKFTKISNSKFNFIVILYYYIYSVYKCMQLDINDYNKYLNSISIGFNSNQNTNINLFITFGDFVVKKYASNIYNDCINELIKLFTNINNYLDFSTYYYYDINNEFNESKFIPNQNIWIYANILDNTEIKSTYDNLNYTPINNYYEFYLNYNYNHDCVKSENKFLINKNFNALYSNSIINLIYKTTNIFYI